MKILDKYELKGKDGDWTLSEHRISTKKKNKGQMIEVTIGYWGKLEHALEKIMGLEASSAETLQGYVDRIEETYKKLRDELNK